jgi:hypothetical protein
MNLDTQVKYSFVVLEKYQDLEDGSPNWHFNSAVMISNQGTLAQFLDSMQKNSVVKGLSIVDINYEIVTNG